MRKRLRNGGQAVSFFAFQDIITSVIGILLLITMLLSLFIGAESSDAIQADVRSAATPAEVNRLDYLIKKISELQKMVVTSISTESPEKLKQKQEMLEGELAALNSQIQKSAPVLSPGTGQGSAEVQKQLDALTAKNSANKKDLDTLKAEAIEKLAIIQSLTKLVEARESELLNEKQHKDDIWLIPEVKGTTKKPLLIIANRDDFEVKTLGSDVQHEGDRKGKDLKVLLQPFDPIDYFVVMYYRPSTFHIYEGAAETVRGLKFELGYDAISEDQEIQFRTEETR